MPGSKVPEENLLEVPEGIEDHHRGGGADGGDGGGVVLAVLQTVNCYHVIVSHLSKCSLTGNMFVWRDIICPHWYD